MPNRLAKSTSLYLRMHANDPVDWYPWGEEAVERARREDRPILLSAGYASCHWCHVMHRESFSDPATAAYLNDHFVPVKVDREVRPDVDELYMAYVVASAGRGGWPMTVAMTPDLRPFVGGTYFPVTPREGMASFNEVLAALNAAYHERRDEVEQAAEGALGYLRTMFAAPSPGQLTSRLVDDAAEAIIAAADTVHGGFGGAPKFPQHTADAFLLAYHELTGEKRSLDAVEAEMDGLLSGGIYDQVGGGVSRYSVDGRWLVPHFEKMLYDNALLLSTLARLQRVDPDRRWEWGLRRTVEFLDRDMAVEGGFFASALDADTEGVEGATYVWSWHDLTEVLTEQELALAREHLGASPEGNWEHSNILARSSAAARDAPLAARVDALLARLKAVRARRAQPERDAKILVSWNALAARGLMDAGSILGDSALTRRATSLTRGLIEQAVRDDGSVAHTVAEGSGSCTELLEDSMMLADAALRAYELSDDKDWLAAARRLFSRAYETFCDKQTGVWYMVPADTELPVRPRERHDGPTPAGAHVAAHVALSISEAVRDRTYRALAEETLRRSVPLILRAPLSAGTALEGTLRLLASE